MYTVASGWKGGLKCKYGVEWLAGGRCLPHLQCMAHMAASLPVVFEEPPAPRGSSMGVQGAENVVVVESPIITIKKANPDF